MDPGIPNPAGYAGRTVTKPPEWHMLVVFDILLNNLATGLFLVAAIAELAFPSAFAHLADWAYPISLLLLLVDFACLVLDLGDPLRFHHMLRVFKPGSPMSLGTWCLTFFALFLTALSGLEALGWLIAESTQSWWTRKILIVGGLPFAFGSAAYKGVLFSTSAQPGWKDARGLGAYFMNSAVMLGAGELLVLALATREILGVKQLCLALMVLVLLNLVSLFQLIGESYTLLCLVYSKRKFVVNTIVFLLAATEFLAALLYSFGGPPAYWIALILLLLASFAVRFVTVRLPHDAVKK